MILCLPACTVCVMRVLRSPLEAAGTVKVGGLFGAQKCGMNGDSGVLAESGGGDEAAGSIMTREGTEKA